MPQRHVRQASDEKAFIDLKGLVRDQLVREGLAAGAITDVAVCTRCSSDRYFSRRSAKGGATGLAVKFYRDAGVILGYSCDAKDQGAIKGNQYQGSCWKRFASRLRRPLASTATGKNTNAAACAIAERGMDL